MFLHSVMVSVMHPKVHSLELSEPFGKSFGEILFVINYFTLVLLCALALSILSTIEMVVSMT